jgi:hypothetical protein
MMDRSAVALRKLDSAARVGLTNPICATLKGAAGRGERGGN